MVTKDISASVYVSFPAPNLLKTAETHQFPLRWWNSHYKSQHIFTGGLIEVVYDRTHRGYNVVPDDDNEVKPEDRVHPFRCPYCHTLHRFNVEIVDRIKGHIQCPTCKKQYGVHPNGHLYVVKDLNKKVAGFNSSKDEMMKWLRQQAYQNDWELEPEVAGVTIIISAKKRTPKPFMDLDGKDDDGLAIARIRTQEDLNKAISACKSMLDAKGLDYQ